MTRTQEDRLEQFCAILAFMAAQYFIMAEIMREIIRTRASFFSPLTIIITIVVFVIYNKIWNVSENKGMSDIQIFASFMTGGCFHL